MRNQPVGIAAVLYAKWQQGYYYIKCIKSLKCWLILKPWMSHSMFIIVTFWLPRKTVKRVSGYLLHSFLSELWVWSKRGLKPILNALGGSSLISQSHRNFPCFVWWGSDMCIEKWSEDIKVDFFVFIWALLYDSLIK